MDYWFWGPHAVFVCADHLAWFDDRGQVLGPGGRIVRQKFDDYLANGPWVEGMPTQVAEEVMAAVRARHDGSARHPMTAGHHLYRPVAGPRTEWEYFGRNGVRFEGDHLLWYEKEGDVRFASGAACEQTFADFLTNGPRVQDVPADVAAEVAAAIVARVEANGGKA